MKKKVLFTVLFALFGVGILNSDVAEASELSSTTAVEAGNKVSFDSLPEDVKEQILLQGYDLETLEIHYRQDGGEEILNRTRAMSVTVQSACYITKNAWGTIITGGWNIRYKTLNVRNGYQQTGFYELYQYKSNNNYVYDRIFTYRTW